MARWCVSVSPVSPGPVRHISPAWPWLGCTRDHYHVLPAPGPVRVIRDTGVTRLSQSGPTLHRADQSESANGVQGGDTGTGITS